MTDNSSSHYDSTTIGLHWTTAFLVLALWIIGQVGNLFPKGVYQTNIWSIHVALGFALATVLIWRIVWRLTGRRRLPAADSGVLHILAEASHYGLYLLLLATVALGVVNAFVRGFSLFDIASLPQFGDKELKDPITEWHGLAANLLLVLAALHTAAALAHHYVLRDGLLMRMVPERQPVPEEPVEF
jgi:cytochrome b561